MNIYKNPEALKIVEDDSVLDMIRRIPSMSFPNYEISDTSLRSDDYSTCCGVGFWTPRTADSGIDDLKLTITHYDLSHNSSNAEHVITYMEDALSKNGHIKPISSVIIGGDDQHIEFLWRFLLDKKIPLRVTYIDYYPPIMGPIYDKSLVLCADGTSYLGFKSFMAEEECEYRLLTAPIDNSVIITQI